MEANANRMIDARDATAAFDALAEGLTLTDAFEAADAAKAAREDAAAREDMAQRCARHRLGMPLNVARWYYGARR